MKKEDEKLKRCARAWTDKEVKKLKELTQDGVTDREIGGILGRTTNSISSKRKSEGIIKDGKRREYAAYRGDVMLSIGTVEEIAAETGYTTNTLEYASYPAHHRRAGEGAIKLYEIEEDDEWVG